MPLFLDENGSDGELEEEIKSFAKWFSDGEVTKYLLPGTPLLLNTDTQKLETVSVPVWLKNISKRKTAAHWKIMHPQYGFIGHASLNAIDIKDMSCERAITIGEKKYWGEGIGKIVGLMLMKAARESGLKKMTSSPYAENTRSLFNVEAQLGESVGEGVDEEGNKYFLFSKDL